jgi:hypothetical protein
VNALGSCLLVLAGGCGSSSGPTLTFTSLNPWDGGADSGCTIGASSTRVGCAAAYAVTGDPYACAGFDDGGSGSLSACQAVCGGLVCSLAGLSNGTNVVDCQADCASPEH